MPHHEAGTVTTNSGHSRPGPQCPTSRPRTQCRHPNSGTPPPAPRIVSGHASPRSDRRRAAARHDAPAGCGKSLPSRRPRPWRGGHHRGRHLPAGGKRAGDQEHHAAGRRRPRRGRGGGGAGYLSRADAHDAPAGGGTGSTTATGRPRWQPRRWRAPRCAAPILYSEGSTLPALSAQALAGLKPTGSHAAARHATGDRDRERGGSGCYRTLALSGEPAALAAQVERLAAVIHGGRPPPCDRGWDGRTRGAGDARRRPRRGVGRPDPAGRCRGASPR